MLFRSIALKLEGLDVILGMDWLATYHANLNCAAKTVTVNHPTYGLMRYWSPPSKIPSAATPISPEVDLYLLEGITPPAMHEVEVVCDFPGDEFFWRDHLNNISILFQGITRDVLLEWLTIHHLRFISIKIINLYSSGMINFLNDECPSQFDSNFLAKNLRRDLCSNTLSPILNSLFKILLSCLFFTFSLNKRVFS